MLTLLYLHKRKKKTTHKNGAQALNARLLLQEKSRKTTFDRAALLCHGEFEVVSIIEMQNRAQGFKPPTSWNWGQSLQLGWVPREVSTLIYMPIPRAVSSLFCTEKIIPACGTRQTLWVPKHGNEFFYAERMGRERTGREKRWGLAWDREVPFHKGNEGKAAQWSSVRRGEVPRSWPSTIPWESDWACKGDVYKAPLVSKSILPLAGASGLGSHLMPLPLRCGGAMAGGVGRRSSAQERPSGASQASLCGCLGGTSW